MSHKSEENKLEELVEKVGETWSKLDVALRDDEFSIHLSRNYVDKEEKEEIKCMRDSTAQVLRCLRVWYDLPPAVLVLALHTLDSFLAKVKVQVKHLPCIALSCFHLAMEWTEGGFTVPLSELVTISQTRCSVQDLLRMQGIILSKLRWNKVSPTSLTFLELFHSLLSEAAKIAKLSHQEPATGLLPLELCVQRLEVLMCNHKCSHLKRSTVALALLNYIMMEESPFVWNWSSYISDLQDFCKIGNGEFCISKNTVYDVLLSYDHQHQLPQHLRQNLNWKLSVRTWRQLHAAMRRHQFSLPPLEEYNDNCACEYHSSTEGKEWNRHSS